MKAQIGKLVGGNKRKKILQFEIENEAIYMGGKYAILRLEDYNELVNGLSTSDEALHIADVVKPKGTLPCIQRCSVCHITMVNWVGSTPCCGGMAEYLYEDEVEELGFVVDMTRNKGTVRPVEG